MANDNAKFEKGLIKDVLRLLDKHGLQDGKTTIKVAPAAAATATESVVCIPPQVPTQITITLPDGTKVTTTICK